MGASTAAIVLALSLYGLLVLVVGLLSTRRSSRSDAEYFLAGRTLGTVVLFMALFGTNCTAFLLVGIPGQSYHDGVGIFSVNVPIIALGIPLTFYLVGGPARREAARLGAVTPAELYARRLDNVWIGRLLFAAYTVYTVPYMVATTSGAALTFESMTERAVSKGWAAAGILLVALTYTALGGMRGTAWTNVVQGTLFMGFMILAFTMISRDLGGLQEAMEKVRGHDADLLEVKEGKYYAPAAWTSWALAITFTVVGFPHMLVRLMAARSENSIKTICCLYPSALVVLWIPAVAIGVWGAVEFPGLEGRASDVIFSRMIETHLPVWLGAVGLLAVLAASMSTLDAQILVLSSMLTRDLLPRNDEAPARGVHTGRIYAILVASAVFVLTMTWGDSVFDIAKFAFSGYVVLTPTLFLGLRWQRFRAGAASASILLGNAVLCVLHFGGAAPGGFLPVFWAFLVAAVTAVVVPLVRLNDSAR